MDSRWCKRCEKTLPLSAFNRYKDGHQWWCRECFRQYFKDRGELHRRHSGVAKKARKARARAFIIEYLRNHPCVDCSQDDVVVLEFDHVRPKQRAICVLVDEGERLQKIAAEIERCEVVCSNCHRRRTYRRRGVDRSVASTEKIKCWRVKRNVAWLYNFLRMVPCVDCGIGDPLVLDFDHVGVKRGPVMQMAWHGYALETIDLEVANCEVRCANCHRRRTARLGGHFRHRATLEALKPP